MKEFKTKTADEIKSLSEEESQKYFADLIEWQTESIKALTEKANIDKDSRAELEKEVNTLKDANISAMKSSLEAQGVQMTKLVKEVEAKTVNEPRSMKAAIYKAISEKADKINALKGNSAANFSIEVKALQDAGDITSGADFADMVQGVGQIATRKPFVRELFNQRNITREYIKYNDQETVVRDAKNVAGCAASTHNSKITYRVRTLQITKVRDMVDVCVDMMEDYEWVSGEVRDLVTTDVALKVDEGLLLGDGTNPELNSISAVASTFAAGDYAASVATPTFVDLIKVGSCLISDAGLNNKFNANYALMNPSDECLMTLEKDTTGMYLLPNWITADGVNIGAVRVMTNSLIPKNEMYIMDSTKGTVVSKKGISVDFSFENNDNFEKELVTAKAYERLNFLVRNVDANAFLHIPDITAAITAITKV